MAPTAGTTPVTWVMPRGGSVQEPVPRTAPEVERSVPAIVTAAVPPLARTRFVRNEVSWRTPTIDRIAPEPMRSEGPKAGTDWPKVPPGLEGSGVEVWPATLRFAVSAVTRIAP